MMKKGLQMTKIEDKTDQIKSAIEGFKTRTKTEYVGDTGNYAYQAGYYETILKVLLLRACDADRDFICDQLLGGK